MGLFSELTAESLDAGRIAQRLNPHPRSASDFLDALVAMGVIERDDGSYRNTPDADRFLDRAKPTYIGGFFEMCSARMYHFWNDLDEALRTGKPQNEIKSGEELFAAIYADPDRLRMFLHSMTGRTRACAQGIAKKFPWPKYRTVIDIGTAARREHFTRLA